ncbi:hypothetical protein A0J61_11274 [Choanephora cucurbitarum]|uniref:Uncharacterized protein n=2 Tax=Choanephora cucurbitarum TaxID=101091 RepID=A0A1C7MV87_9FUNG|nr:hypothetical protein A0J61_11274 [Choanephora cucurbitarum]
MDSIDFGKEQAWLKVMPDTHASCSALVDQVIVEETPRVDRSDDSPSANTSTSNASTSQNETNRENTNKNNTSSHSNATDTISNSFPPSSTTFFDNDNYNDSSSDESFSPWLIHNTNITDLFQAYKQQMSTTESTFRIETDLQEILALSDILFLALDEGKSYIPRRTCSILELQYII